MKTRRTFILILLVIAACVLSWHYLPKPSSEPAEQPSEQPLASRTKQPAPSPATDRQSQMKEAGESTNNQSKDLGIKFLPSGEIDWKHEEEKRRRATEEGLSEWRTPIVFYGKVIDENTNSVAGAHVDFDCNDTSPSGTSFYHTETDSSGLFSIRDIRGKLLGVTVSKAGYYTPRQKNFEYGDRYARFFADAANPLVFRLKKKGAAEPLVHVQAPMGGPKGFQVAKDGTAVEVSLATGKVVPPGQGDLRVQCWTDDQGTSRGKKYDWKCQITVPNGGIVQYDEEFPFQAPLAGYQPSSEIDVPANLETGWSRSAKRNYFLKLANGNYARMNFEMVAGGDHFFQLESFLNPSGASNLEFDPQIAINP